MHILYIVAYRHTVQPHESSILTHYKYYVRDLLHGECLHYTGLSTFPYLYKVVQLRLSLP